MKWETKYFDDLTEISERCRNGLVIYVLCDTAKIRNKIIKELKLSLSWGRGVFYYTKGILVVGTIQTDIDIFDKYYKVKDGRQKRNQRRAIGSKNIITL